MQDWINEVEAVEAEQLRAEQRDQFERMLELNGDITIGTIADDLGISEQLAASWYEAIRRDRRQKGIKLETKRARALRVGLSVTDGEDDRNSETPARFYDAGKVEG